MTTTHDLHLLSYVEHELAKTQHDSSASKIFSNERKEVHDPYYREELHEVNAAAQ